MEHLSKKSWWGAPKKLADQEERKVSFLELFYDLVYVVLIAQLTHHLAAHLVWSEIGYFFFMFALVFWSWVNGSLYHDLHASPGVRTRFFTMLQMMAIAAVAVTIEDVYEGHHLGFAISFAIVQAIITYLWWSVGHYDISYKALSKYYIICYTMALGVLTASVFLPYSVAVVLWITALIFNLGAGLVAWPSLQKALVEMDVEFAVSESMLERFGLFTIIVLGETILGIVGGVAGITEKTLLSWTAFILGILVAFLLWWVYFELMDNRKVKSGYKYLQLMIFLHLPLLACLGIIGATISSILSEGDIEHHHGIRWIFGLAISLFLISGIGLSRVLQPMASCTTSAKKINTSMLLAAALIMLVALIGGHLEANIFIAANAIILLVTVIIGAKAWALNRNTKNELSSK